MKKKMICIGIIVLFLLTSLATFPITGMRLKVDNNIINELGNIKPTNNDEDVIDPEWVTTWHEQNMPEGRVDEGKDIAIDEDNGYIYVAGYGVYADAERPCINFLLQYDLKGDLTNHKIWERGLHGLPVCEHNGYVYIARSPPSQDKLIVEKYDQDLDNPIWVISVEEDDNEAGWYISPGKIVEHNGFLYIAGRIGYDGRGSESFLYKFNTIDGDIEWKKTWAPECHDLRPLSIAKHNDYIYICGWKEKGSCGNLECDIFVLKYNTDDGKLVNEAIWDGGSGRDDWATVIIYHEEHLYVFGNTAWLSFSRQEIILLKYDLELNQIGERQRLLYDYDWNLVEDAIIYNGHIFVVGEICDPIVPYALLAKYDLDGNMYFCKTGPSSETSHLRRACAISAYDNNLYITGSRSSPKPYGDAFLMKCNEDGSHGLTANAGGPYKGKNDTEICFYGTVSGGTPSYTYSWDFDDSDGIQEDITDQNPIYTYANVGAYTATLTVTDSNGDIDSDMVEVTITKDKSANLVVFNFLQRLADRFPIFEKLLQLPVFTSLLN